MERFRPSPEDADSEPFLTVKHGLHGSYPLELVRKQMVPRQKLARRMSGVLEMDGAVMSFSADPVHTGSVREDKQRDWVPNYPRPFAERLVLMNTTGYTEEELTALVDCYPQLRSPNPETEQRFFQRYEEEEAYRERYCSLVEKACREAEKSQS